MYDLTRFSEADAEQCGAALRRFGTGQLSMEGVANQIVDFLYSNLTAPGSSEPACALVRFYKTHPYAELDAELQAFAQGILGHASESPDMKCLTLLATRGAQPDWNDRRKSAGHKAIPLPSEKFVSQIPMISRLVNQFGLDLNAVLRPDPAIIVDLEQKTYNAFHVPEAIGSPYIPAQQEFVIPNDVRSVLGFGGVLASGDLFVVILFAKVHIPPETTDLAKDLALDVKSALQPFVQDQIFA
jgi:hypothetical protein